LSPAEVLIASTSHAARAAKQAAELGSLAPGMTASLWMLTANPLEDAANLSEAKAARIMTAGEWTR
jgi:imidazolonepropionase-like amidohydrolase